jgi:hypothetical protein
MRLRKLGHGQSVLIIAPPEIDRAIRSVGNSLASVKVTVVDVIRWAMLETCADIHRHIPHWVEQGLDYKARNAAHLAYEALPDINKLRDGWLRPEAKTLGEMYGWTESQRERVEFQTQAFGDSELRARLDAIGVTRIVDARLSEEQEREVNHEVERERQVQRPPKLEPAIHSLHPDVKSFVRTGRLLASSKQFKPLSHLLCGVALTASGTTPRLYCTVDFLTTVRVRGPDAGLHDYLRPVHWILSRSSTLSVPKHLVAISPYEANKLLPTIRQSNAGVRLHIYAPRLMQNMKPFSDLRFFSIPLAPHSWCAPVDMRSQLGLWAGQLFIDDRETYKKLCGYLGLYMGCTEGEVEKLRARGLIHPDGFVKDESRSAVGALSLFNESPVEKLRELFGLRRKGMPYLTTHMGRVLNARTLQDEDFA